METLFLHRIAQPIDCPLHSGIARLQVQRFTDFFDRYIVVRFDLGFDVLDVFLTQ